MLSETNLVSFVLGIASSVVAALVVVCATYFRSAARKRSINVFWRALVGTNISIIMAEYPNSATGEVVPLSETAG